MNKNLKTNLIFTLVLLVIAGGAFFWQRTTARSGPQARLDYGKEQSLLIPLSRDRSYDVDTGKYTVHLQVEDGRIRFVDSPCPDHLCEGFGWLQNEGDWAACLPAEALLTVLGEE